MAVEEIYTKLAEHMLQGVMIHNQFIKYYSFLGLKKLAMYHKERFCEEAHGYNKLNVFYIKHHGKLILESEIENKSIVPTTWYDHETNDVDSQTIRTYVKEGYEIWVKWEEKTKEFLNECYINLMAEKAVVDACFIKEYLCDVEKELCEAKCEQRKLELTDYDISTIVR